MLYVHQLNHLTPKIAELESVYLVRELKQKHRYPLQAEKVAEEFSDLRISETDTQFLQEALALIGPTIELVNNILLQKDPLHEPINIQRTLQLLKELPPYVINQLEYLEDITVWQEPFLRNIASLLNTIPKLRTTEEKIRVNNQLKEIFQKILRNPEMHFNATDLIGEGSKAQIEGLHESMMKGFFFKVTLEEELKKVDFAIIQKRLPSERLAETETIERNIANIKRGLERAYQVNMCMVHCAVILYAYIKWMMNP